MAEVSLLQFAEEDHDLFIENDFLIEDVTTLDSNLCWPNIPPRDCDFSPFQIAIEDDEDEIFGPSLISAPSIGSSNSTDNNVLLEDRKNQVNFVMDLFHQRVEQSHLVGGDLIALENVNDSNLGVVEENHDMGVNDLDLELRLGLGLGLEDDDNFEEGSNCCGFVVTDCGDEFYIARRESGSGNGNKNDAENPSSSSRVGGLMVVGVDSDSEEEEEDDDGNELLFHGHSEEEEFGVDNVNDDDDDNLSISLRWDTFLLEEEDDHIRNYSHDFEWEEVDDRVVDTSSATDIGLIISGPEEDGVGERERGEFGHLTWEVLLDANHLGRDSEMMENAIDIDDQDDMFNAAEYEMMFGQFAESENAFSGRPPASKSAVDSLTSVITTEEDVLNEKALCAVCKDQIEVGKEGKQLPCSHRYHGDCIIPWLGIRNTCPVCRYELPTDNNDYEQRRLRRATRAV